MSCSTADIESDRLLAVRKLTARYGGVAVLKGAGTLIADEQGQMAIADVGNAGIFRRHGRCAVGHHRRFAGAKAPAV